MAQIKLTEEELRGIIRNVISESNSKKRISEMPNIPFKGKRIPSEYELETPENIKFIVKGYIEKDGDDYYRIGDDDYWLAGGPYTPEEEQLIREYMEYNKEDVEQEIVNQAEQNDNIDRDSHNEYTPEDIHESLNENLLTEENINDFFTMLEKDPKRKSFAYIYYTMPVAVNKFIIDENGNKIPNPMDGKLFKNKQIKFNYAETFKEVMGKRDPDYVLGKKSGTYEKLGGYDVIESGKNGLYMPVLPKSSRDEYSIFDENGWKPVRKEEIQQYLRPVSNYVDNGKPIVNQLIVDRIARISAGGHVWNNPNFKYKYLGPKQETFESI